ncbi:DUF1896 family protein [Sphingobacterium endophyticum]|uniref:DUF1896 family protein n=1 Tax=Sphingobacterium endophyticum TaxID=2546448 RepID=UPI0037427693
MPKYSPSLNAFATFSKFMVQAKIYINFYMDKQQKDLSYFILRLQELLHTSFPEMTYQIKFIHQSSS